MQDITDDGKQQPPWPEKPLRKGQRSFDEKDRKLIQAWKMCGFNDKQIAHQFQCSVGNLKKHCPSELENGSATMLMMLTAGVVKDALNGSKADRFFILKTRGGFRETNRHEHTGADGQPLDLFAGFSVDDLTAIKAALREAEIREASGPEAGRADGRDDRAAGEASRDLGAAAGTTTSSD